MCPVIGIRKLNDLIKDQDHALLHCQLPDGFEKTWLGFNHAERAYHGLHDHGRHVTCVTGDELLKNPRLIIGEDNDVIDLTAADARIGRGGFDIFQGAGFIKSSLHDIQIKTKQDAI